MAKIWLVSREWALVSRLTLTHQTLNLIETAHAHSRPSKIWVSCSRSLTLTLFFEYFGTLHKTLIC